MRVCVQAYLRMRLGRGGRGRGSRRRLVVAIDDAVVYDQGVTPGPCGRDVTIVIRGTGRAVFRNRVLRNDFWHDEILCE